jgi:exosortase E/protease (VPEID-CTERM system)
VAWLGVLALLGLEFAWLTRHFDTDFLIGQSAWWVGAVRFTPFALSWAACVGGAIAVLGHRRLARRALRLGTGEHDLRAAMGALVAHAATLAVFQWSTPLLLAGGPVGDVANTVFLGAWLACLGGLVLSGLSVAAPPRALRAFAWSCRAPLAGGLVAGSLAFGLAKGWEHTYWAWRPLAEATMSMAAAMLRLVEPELIYEPGEELLFGTPEFLVIVSKYCSGYAGITLFSFFYSGFLILARRRLRFPHALLLWPLGLVAVFTLNAVRIAVLVSRELALDAFHTYAGWPFLILVALGAVFASLHLRWFASAEMRADHPRSVNAEGQRWVNPTAVYLMPLLAAVGGGLLLGACSPDPRLTHPLRAVLAAGCLWHYRRELPRLWKLPAPATWAWAAVGTAVWIAADGVPPVSALPGFLEGRSSWIVGGWLASMALSYVVVTPIAEELAFRGFLQRRVQHAEFERVPLERWSASGVAVSAVAFGALHGNWIGGVAVGVIFSLCLRGPGRLAEAVACHALINGALAVLAASTGRWGWWF